MQDLSYHPSAPIKQKTLNLNYAITLNAFEIVDCILSRIKPPAKVPKIPQTTVIPPNNKSALLWQR